tara:strand:+ start:57 stop:836 length:780 start_codon:yes stop_codon:yes gene_type:complete
MQHSTKKFKLLLSVKLFLLVLATTLFFFYFLDLKIYLFSKNLNGYLSLFFIKIINPLAKIFNPSVILPLSFFVLVLIISLKKVLKSPEKLKILITKFDIQNEVLQSSLNYYLLIIKHIIFSIILSGFVLHLLKYIFGVSRPKYYFNHDYERYNFFNFEHKVNSLPSGHTQAAFTIAILFVLYFNKCNFFFILIAAFIGISRIFMSAHFPSDIIIGAYVGAIFPILLYNSKFRNDFLGFNKKKIIDFNVFLKLICMRFFI